MLSIGVIGLGEAGSVYARAFAEQGHLVYGVDPAPVDTPSGVRRVDDLTVVEGLDAVVVVTSARVGQVLAETVLPKLPASTLWVDMTTATPAQKARIAESDVPARHVDVAILGPVVTLGITTPLLVAGESAGEIARLFAEAGASVDTVDAGQPGDAMAHKLLRSVFMKGLAAVVTEAVSAGKAAGREEWVREQMAAVLAGDGQGVIDRFLVGSVKHAARRSHEMHGVVEYLGDLGIDSDMSAGATAQLTRLAAVANA